MKAVTVKELKQELKTRNSDELMELCLKLAKFKKESKELLTYLLFEADDETAYIASVKAQIDEQFAQVNKKSYYFIRKGLRKILTSTKKYIRFSKKTATEVELLIYYCQKLNDFSPSIKRSANLRNLYDMQVAAINKKVKTLHEDLQYDYQNDIEAL